MTQTVVLGIRMDSKTRDSWHSLAKFIDVPTNRMLLFIVKSWGVEHFKELTDSNLRNKLKAIIERLYLEGKLG